MFKSLQQQLFDLALVRAIVATALLCRGYVWLASGRTYRGLVDIARVCRISTLVVLGSSAARIVFRAVREIDRRGRNHIVDTYLEDRASARCAALYTLTGGPHDLFRDLIVLKRWRPGEKGVILLKYVRTFDAVVAMLDIERLLERYTFVLEPCWAGYCDPNLLMFVQPGQPVFVQCFTSEDEEFVSSVGAPLVAVPLGPADWVDADLFKPSSDDAKVNDLVMVANWAPHKRHRQLFRALREIRDRRVRVLLIGFPWSGRTADDVRREAAIIRNPHVHVEVLERLAPREVAHHVSRSKAFVFLSRKEGDNKALVEAMFADVPAIVYDKTIGGAGRRVNGETGIFASDEGLADRIRFMLEHWREFSPRAWALAHTGSTNATRMLNDALRRQLVAAGMPYTEDIVEKTNSPNLEYKDRAQRARFQADYEFVLECLRPIYRPRQDAVA